MHVPSLLMTGFPGFLGSALLPRLLRRRDGHEAICLVQPQHLVVARSRVKELEVEHPELTGRIRLVLGDITAPGLGLEAGAVDLRDVHELWHLAAVYDLAVPPDLARKVNVDGTRNVLDLAAGLPRLRRLQYVSTCYVSGRYTGEFTEDALEAGQAFRNHYEETKHEAELLVHKAKADGLPVTIYRPGIVVGDSLSGATQKYDGPYFLAGFIRRQRGPLAVVPAVGDADAVRVCLVPRDFVVSAMDELSVLEESEGRTYALVDPDPPTVRELVETFARHYGKKVLWVPLPLRPVHVLVDSVPGMETLLGLPAEALDYFASPTTYATTATDRDLAGTDVRCPAFATYAGRLLDFMDAHPEYDAKAMV